jgi:methyl-accepting chemotaxis protein
MNLLNNLKIRTKLNILVGFVSLLLVGIGATGLIGINSSNKALSSVYNDHLIAINQLNDIRNYQMQIRLAMLVARQENDAFEVMGYMDKVRGYIFQIENLLKAYSEHKPMGKEKQLLDAFVDARLNFGRNGVMPMIDLLQAEKFQEADTLRRQTMEPAYAKASDAIDVLIQYQVDAAKKKYEHVTSQTQAIRIISIASIIIGLSLSIIAGFVITRSVGRGVASLEKAASRLANGDLTTRVNTNSKDELGEVARAFNKMAEDFTALIGQVRQSADQVTSSADLVSTTAEQVANGSRGQTSEAEVAASSVEDLNEMVKEVADKAEHVLTAANEASAMSDEGQQVVNNAVRGIQQVAQTVSESASLIAALGQRSDQIGQIVKVIKDIADQTNLLALNAAIEAARAGEQGRGFAVVADEVRKLAERTTKATSEISDMISAIQSETGSAVSTMEKGSSQVSQGVDLASQAGKSLQNIDQSVKQVVEMIQQIASATKSQSAASDRITTRVEQIVLMAKENGSAVEQTEQATHDLQKLSAHLQQVVSRFKL